MFIESEILVGVLLQLVDRGITALPVHDAIIVPGRKAPTAKDVMLLHEGVAHDSAPSSSTAPATPV